MPVRLNLLAEQQMAEELRRRDPVKRCIWGAAFIVALVLLWCLYLQFQIWISRGETSVQETKWKTLEANNSQVTTNKNKTLEIEKKLDALHNLATNRFLWGPVFNALQFSVPNDIQVLRLRTYQSFAKTKSEKTGSGKIKPATSTESGMLIIEALDYGPPSGEEIDQFKKNLLSNDYLMTILTNENSIRLTARSQRQQDPIDPNRWFVGFTLECYFPEKTR